jgi:hypothetical protein
MECKKSMTKTKLGTPKFWTAKAMGRPPTMD